MSDEKTKLRIKSGAGELDYEGSAQFLKDEVMPMITRIIDLVDTQPQLRAPMPTIDAKGTPIQLPPTLAIDHSTTTIATLLNASSGGDLIIAAVAHLVLVQSRTAAKRAEILAEMKTATPFYKSSMSNNMSTALNALVKADRLRSPATGTCTLSHKEQKALEPKLAQAQ